MDGTLFWKIFIKISFYYELNGKTFYKFNFFWLLHPYNLSNGVYLVKTNDAVFEKIKCYWNTGNDRKPKQNYFLWCDTFIKPDIL